MDWGSIIRRCMRYEAQLSEWLPPDSALEKRSLREESLLFSIAHANQFDPLLTFLDELSEVSRFRTLELNLQSCLLVHLADLTKVFSSSRLEKLFDDITEFFSSDSSPKMYNSNQTRSLRISFWRGLCQCLDEASLSSLEYMPNVEKCMEVLFSMLNVSESSAVGSHMLNPVQEWREAVKCLAKARVNWLLDFLQVNMLLLSISQVDDIFRE